MVAPEILMTDSAAVDYIRNFIENDNKLVVMAENMKPGGTLEIMIGGSKLTDLIIMFGVDKFKMFAQRCVMDIVKEKYPGIDIKKEFEGNIDVRIVETNKMLMRKINPKQENIPILFDCTVSAVDERKTYIIRATVQCPRCGGTKDVKSDINFKLPNIVCGKSSCHGSKMQPNPRKTVTEYVQIVRLQEPLEEAKHNSPVSFIAKARGLTVGKIYMGQKKRITGIFTTDYDMKKQEHQIVIEIIDAEDLQAINLHGSIYTSYVLFGFSYDSNMCLAFCVSSILSTLSLINHIMSNLVNMVGGKFMFSSNVSSGLYFPYFGFAAANVVTLALSV